MRPSSCVGLSVELAGPYDGHRRDPPSGPLPVPGSTPSRGGPTRYPPLNGPHPCAPARTAHATGRSPRRPIRSWRKRRRSLVGSTPTTLFTPANPTGSASPGCQRPGPVTLKNIKHDRVGQAAAGSVDDMKVIIRGFFRSPPRWRLPHVHDDGLDALAPLRTEGIERGVEALLPFLPFLRSSAVHSMLLTARRGVWSQRRAALYLAGVGNDCEVSQTGVGGVDLGHGDWNLERRRWT